MKPRKTVQLSLVLIASVSIVSCSDTTEQPARRDLYRSLEDCQREWRARAQAANTTTRYEDDCETVTDSNSSGGSSRSYVYGPRYAPSNGGFYVYHRNSSQPQLLRLNSSTPSQRIGVQSTTVRRGGFGSTGSRIGGGGS
jgi:uncharacterized protein YgiB involved in biofilm formation